MIILGIDTSSLAASCALWAEGKLVGEYFSNAGLTHSQTVMPMTQSLLENTRFSFKEVDGFAVSAGPGSFTGLRIGIAAAKGMASALGKPCAPVSTLEGLAWNISCFSGYIVPVMDARCRQVYTALFQSGGDAPIRVEPDSALSLGELRDRLQTLDRPILLVGDGARLCKEALGEVEGLSVAPEALLHQRASSVCRVAMGQERWIPAGDLVPAYLRLPQAQRELLKRQGKITG